jgi:hypothetical protein
MKPTVCGRCSRGPSVSGVITGPSIDKIEAAELGSEQKTCDQAAEHGPRSGEASWTTLPELGGESVTCCLFEPLFGVIVEMNLKIEGAVHVSRFPMVVLYDETNHDQGDSAQYRHKSARHKRSECDREIGALSRALHYVPCPLLDREPEDAKRDQQPAGEDVPRETGTVCEAQPRASRCMTQAWPAPISAMWCWPTPSASPSRWRSPATARRWWRGGPRGRCGCGGWTTARRSWRYARTPDLPMPWR